jgi:hypothetical protein
MTPNSTGLIARLAATTLAAALVLAVPAVCAQTPAPAASAVPAVVLPKPECGTKPDHPGKLASDAQKRQWRKEANAYLECYKKYASDQREVAQKYQEAANKAIDDYNAAVKDMQAQLDAANQ